MTAVVAAFCWSRPRRIALEQFTITTSNYAADLGNSSGGLISMAVKSGTRQFHGSAWEYNRNDALDAYSYFLKQTPGAKKAELRYNAFGFNIGGPVEFRSSNPKTFFFYNQEWRREINGGAIHKLVPTAKMFGFGSGTTVSNNPDMTGEGTIYVPQTTDPVQLAKFSALGLTPGQPFPNNQIPLSLVDPTAKAYLAAGYMLPPNDASGQYYNSSANTSTFYREEIARVDHQFTKKFTVFGHLIYDSLSQAAPTVAWTGNTYPTIGSLENVPSWQGVVHATYQIRPNLLNEAAFNENGNNILITNTGSWHTPSGFTTTPLFNSNTINKVPGIDFNGGAIGVSMDNGNWPWTNTWRSNQYKDDLSWVRGTHNFKFGFAWLHTHKNQQIFTDTAGTYRFNGNATGCSRPTELRQGDEWGWPCRLSAGLRQQLPTGPNPGLSFDLLQYDRCLRDGRLARWPSSDAEPRSSLGSTAARVRHEQSPLEFLSESVESRQCGTFHQLYERHLGHQRSRLHNGFRDGALDRQVLYERNRFGWS